MNRKVFVSGPWNKLLKFNAESFKKGDIVIAGVSGGADSVAMLHFLKHLSGRQKFKVIAVHVNHSLRQNAARDQAFTKKLCKELGVQCIVKKVNVRRLAKEESLSTEHAARKARYGAFEEAAKENKARKIALAHHLDDHAETILLNLLRGTRVKGLLGIPARRALGKKVIIIRPFLVISRREVLAYIRFNKLDFVTDETNEDQQYLRNWVRRSLIPSLEIKQPKIKEHLLAFAKDLERTVEKNDNSRGFQKSGRAGKNGRALRSGKTP